MKRATAGVVLVLVAVLAVACGGGNTPVTPTPTTPAVYTVAPATGTTFGGTEITISGARFPAGATVTIGGAAATNIAVVDAGTIKATTPQHAAGAADVTVSGSTGAGTLPQGFTYTAPTGTTNTPPVITSLTVKGRKANEPAGFADLSETLDVTAVVNDADTPISQLVFQWTADKGTFTGSGPVVTWTAPGSSLVGTPTTATVTLTVVESYKAPDPTTGLPVDKEFKVTSTSSVSVHDSKKEIGDMAEDFLTAFSNSSIKDPNVVLRDFSTSCAGYSNERDDVIANRKNFTIQAYQIGTASVTENFGGACTLFPDRNRPADGCALVPAQWTSLNVTTGKTETVKGTDQVTAIYLNPRWWLCDSDYKCDNCTTVSSLRFKK